MFILLALSMKAPSKSAESTESHFTLIVLLFLTAMTLFLASMFFSEARQTRAELSMIKQYLVEQK